MQTLAILAFDVGGTRIKAGLVHEATVSCMRVEPLPEQKDADNLINALIHLGREILQDQQQAIQAIGVSIKGIIDPQKGIILDVNESLSDLIGRPFAHLLSQAFQVPVFLENDARMYTVGEMVWGAGREVENLLCLTLGTGIGCGVALQRRVVRGARDLFGTMGGHITIQADGPRCTCGNIGCLEALIGTRPLLEKAVALYELHTRPDSTREALTLQSLFIASAMGDEVARQVVAYFAHYLAVGIVSLIHAYDPDIVVLGGGIASSSPQFLPVVQEYIAKHSWTYPRGRVQVKVAELGDTAALVGVSALACGLTVLL